MSKARKTAPFSCERNVLIFTFLSLIFLMIFLPQYAEATVESSIKNVNAGLQKIGLATSVGGFSLGGIGMMFGARWGYGLVIGSILGSMAVLGGPSMMNFFQSTIR